MKGLTGDLLGLCPFGENGDRQECDNKSFCSPVHRNSHLVVGILWLPPRRATKQMYAEFRPSVRVRRRVSSMSGGRKQLQVTFEGTLLRLFYSLSKVCTKVLINTIHSPVSTTTAHALRRAHDDGHDHDAACAPRRATWLCRSPVHIIMFRTYLFAPLLHLAQCKVLQANKHVFTR